MTFFFFFYIAGEFFNLKLRHLYFSKDADEQECTLFLHKKLLCHRVFMLTFAVSRLHKAEIRLGDGVHLNNA